MEKIRKGSRVTLPGSDLVGIVTSCHGRVVKVRWPDQKIRLNTRKFLIKVEPEQPIFPEFLKTLWGLTAAFLSFTLLPGATTAIEGMPVVGYADRLSVQPGQTIRFMVSCDFPRYRVDLVRLIHGDINPRGPGYKEETIPASINQSYPGRRQRLPGGSYALIEDQPALRLRGSFTLQAWISASTPGKGAQGILTKYSESDRQGYGLVLEEDGSLALWLGDPQGKVERVRTRRPLRRWVPASVYANRNQMVNSTSWYFVAATFEAKTGRVVLYQKPSTEWPRDETLAVVEQAVSTRTIGQTDASLLIAAYWSWRDGEESRVGGHFNGKIENPHVFNRALTSSEIDLLYQGQPPDDPVAAWDFSAEISSRRVHDTSANGFHGETVQMPTRGVTAHSWTGRPTSAVEAPAQYAAIHFHEDDLDDAGWEVDFEYRVPPTLESGVYAARLRAGNAEDFIPFFVRPQKGTATAQVAFLAPTFSYLAYANWQDQTPQLLSLYSHHSDGSGVCYSSRLRPILEMRPKVAWEDSGDVSVGPHGFNADLHLVDWLQTNGYRHDVLTDEDLHFEGWDLLKPYRVVITGAHPEYWSQQMLDGLESYLRHGGRLMYLGGNGFYWVTSMESEEKHTIEIRRRAGTETWQAAPGEYHHSTTGELGGLWRFRGRPPQKLVGVGFTAQADDRGRPFSRRPGSFDSRAQFIFEGIGPDEPIGDFPCLVLEYGAAGLEIDRLDPVLGSPQHALVLATATGFSDMFQHVVEEVLVSDSKQSGSINPRVKADMIFFEYPNGGAVFSASSISWSSCLSYNDYKNNVSRITENVLRGFLSKKSFGQEEK